MLHTWGQQCMHLRSVPPRSWYHLLSILKQRSHGTPAPQTQVTSRPRAAPTSRAVAVRRPCRPREDPPTGWERARPGVWQRVGSFRKGHTATTASVVCALKPGLTLVTAGTPQSCRVDDSTFHGRAALAPRNPGPADTAGEVTALCCRKNWDCSVQRPGQ